MILTFAEDGDLNVSPFHRDRIVVVIHGELARVERGDGVEVPPFLDAPTPITDRVRLYQLLPYGPAAQDLWLERKPLPNEPFVKGPELDPLWDFHVEYGREGLRRALVALLASMGERGVEWLVDVEIGGVMFSRVAPLRTIDWYIPKQALWEFLFPPDGPLPELSLSKECTTTEFLGIGRPMDETAKMVGMTTAELENQIRSWEAEGVPLRSRCVLLHEMAKKRGLKLQWYDEPKPGRKNLRIVPREKEPS